MERRGGEERRGAWGMPADESTAVTSLWEGNSPLKLVKFPQSRKEVLKEGRELLKSRSLLLEGSLMLSVNRFIWSRVLIR